MVDENNNDFINAVKMGNIAKLDQFDLTILNVNATDNQKKTALLIATENRDSDIVHWLLKHGADVDYHHSEIKCIDKTAFLYAGANGFDEILELLIDHNPDVSILNGYGGTALIPACERGLITTVKLLLEKTSINVNHVNFLGWTALLEAIILSNGGSIHQEIVRILLQNGADPTIPDKDGVLPIQHAKNKGYKEMINIIELYSKF